MGKRFFFPLFLLAIVLILLAVLTRWGTFFMLGLLVILFVAALVRRRHRLLLGAAIVLTVFLTLSVTLQTHYYRETIRDATVTGRVSAIWHGTNEQVLVLEDVTIEKNGKTFDCMKVEVSLPEDRAEAFHAGYVLKIRGDAYGNGSIANNPGERTLYLTALASKRSHFIRSCTRIEVLSYQLRPDSVFEYLRGAIREKINSVGEEEAVHDVMYAMITGDRRPVSADVYDSFTGTGTAHLLAVSGLHISVLLGVILALLRRLPVRPIFYLAPFAALLAFYCLLTGLSASVLRAALMAFIWMCASALGTRYDPLNALCLAGLAILLYNPFRLFDCSFQLSFSAFFGIVAYHRAKRFSALSLTLSATLGSLPVSLYVFRRYAPLSVPANLLFVPIASTALMLTFLALLLSALIPPLCVLLIVPYRMVYLLLFLAQKAQEATPSILSAPFAAWWLIPAFALLVFFSRYLHARAKLKRAVAAVLIVLLVFCVIGSAVLEANTVTLCAIASNRRTPAVHVKCGAEVLVHSVTEDAFAYLGYVENNVIHVDALFVLTQTEANLLPYYWEEGTIGEIYFLPDLTPPEEMIAPGRILNAPVTIGRAVFSPVPGGLTVRYRDQVVFIEADRPTRQRVSAAIGHAGSNAEILISREEDDPNADAVYPTRYYGCVWLTLGTRTEAHPFHEVMSYESY